MAERAYFRKKANRPVIAVQIDIDFDEIRYQKWGDTQRCKPGDWLVNNNNDTYTVNREYFRTHYKNISPGVYEKEGEIWAEVAPENGTIKTIEGSTAYIAGDYLVFDRQIGGTGYAIGKVDFERMYDKIDEKSLLSENQKDYIANRINAKIDELKKIAHHNRLMFYIFQTVSISAASLVPVLTPFISQKMFLLKLTIAILGFVSAAAGSFLTYFKFQVKWSQNDSAWKELESNLIQFNNKVGSYSDTQRAYKHLVENCERILKQ